MSTDGISGSRSWRGLGGLLLVEKTLEFGATDNGSGANLERLDTALADELVEQGSGDAEILRGFDDGEAGLGRTGSHGDLLGPPVSYSGRGARGAHLRRETGAFKNDCG